MKRKRAVEPSLCDRFLVPIEIEKQILSRLPVKSLLRFKCVRKSWRNLIEDPSFVTMHTILLGKTTNGFLLCDFSPTPYYIGKKRNNTVLSGSQEILVSSRKWLLREADRYIVGSNEGLVYSLNTNSWKKTANPRLDLSLESRRGKFFNGACHWLGKQLDSPKRMIVAFKFKEEVLVEINLPNHHNFEDENVVNVYIAEYQNLLFLISYRHDENVVDVWVRKEDGVAEYSWIKQFSIEIPIPKHKLYRQKMMNFEKNGELFLVLNRVGKLVWYNTKTNRIEKVQELGDEVWQVISCKQSLVSLPAEIGEHLMVSSSLAVD
ncbi:hypothetical protein DITRI_Ditri09bG0093700 [Diplodiscus trichospermus]